MKLRFLYLLLIWLCWKTPGALAHTASEERNRESITVEQYSTFLNEISSNDSEHCYERVNQQLLRSGALGDYHYEVLSEKANDPVIFLSWQDAVAYASWIKEPFSLVVLPLFLDSNTAGDIDPFLKSNLLTFCLGNIEATIHQAGGPEIAGEMGVEEISEGLIGLASIFGWRTREELRSSSSLEEESLRASRADSLKEIPLVRKGVEVEKDEVPKNFVGEPINNPEATHELLRSQELLRVSQLLITAVPVNISNRLGAALTDRSEEVRVLERVVADQTARREVLEGYIKAKKHVIEEERLSKAAENQLELTVRRAEESLSKIDDLFKKADQSPNGRTFIDTWTEVVEAIEQFIGTYDDVQKLTEQEEGLSLDKTLSERNSFLRMSYDSYQILLPGMREALEESKKAWDARKKAHLWISIGDDPLKKPEAELAKEALDKALKDPQEEKALLAFMNLDNYNEAIRLTELAKERWSEVKNLFNKIPSSAVKMKYQQSVEFVELLWVGSCLWRKNQKIVTEACLKLIPAMREKRSDMAGLINQEEKKIKQGWNGLSVFFSGHLESFSKKELKPVLARFRESAHEEARNWHYIFDSYSENKRAKVDELLTPSVRLPINSGRTFVRSSSDQGETDSAADSFLSEQVAISKILQEKTKDVMRTEVTSPQMLISSETREREDTFDHLSFSDQETEEATSPHKPADFVSGESTETLEMREASLMELQNMLLHQEKKLAGTEMRAASPSAVEWNPSKPTSKHSTTSCVYLDGLLFSKIPIIPKGYWPILGKEVRKKLLNFNRRLREEECDLTAQEERELYQRQNEAYQAAHEALKTYRENIQNSEEPTQEVLWDIFKKVVTAHDSWEGVHSYCVASQQQADSRAKKECWDNSIAVANREVAAWKHALQQFDPDQEQSEEEVLPETDLLQFPFATLVKKKVENNGAKEIRLLKTMLKYPLIRVEEAFNEAGDVLRRIAMVADHLLIKMKNAHDIKARANLYEDLFYNSSLGATLQGNINKEGCLLHFSIDVEKDSQWFLFPPPAVKAILEKHECSYEPDYLER